jgi:CBS-domain-containing membrane protein
VNLAFFLTPKAEVVWVPGRATLRQALERMEFHRYSAVPLLDEEGRYLGTLTEGDLLWKIRSIPGFTWTDAERLTIADVPRRLEVHPVSVAVQIEELLNRAVEQNFVPVVDSREVFMGIVTRKALIEYCIGRLRPH